MTKISNQYSLTNILTADLANSRLGINNVSPTVALDVTGAGKFSGVLTLGSTISNGTYTYTLPSATGTLALTSALSGTTNYVPKFTSSTAIGIGLIQDNGTDIGINGSPTSISGYTSLTINNTSNGSFIDLNNSGVNNLRFLCLSSIDQRIQASGNLRFDTAGVARLTIASTGAATFSSSVTATIGNLSTIIGANSGTWISNSLKSDLGNNSTLPIINGKANSFYNAYTMIYNHIADGSASNFLGLGFYGADNAFKLYANGAATFSSSVQIGSTLNNSLSVGSAAPTTDTLNQIFAGQAAFGGQNSAGGETDIGHNWYYYSGWKYRFTSPSSNIKLNGDVISFERAASGTANAAIAFLESMRITSGGQVLINTTTTTTGGVYHPLIVKGTSNASQGIWVEAYSNDAGLYLDQRSTVGAIGISYRSTAGYLPLVFETSGAERMRITAGGNLLVGQTADNPVVSHTVGVRIAAESIFSNAASECLSLQRTTSTGTMAVFYYWPGSGGYVNVGNISTNGSTITFSGTALSDARYKENIIPITNALESINQVDWVEFKFKENQKNSAGITAQQLKNIDALSKFVIDGSDEESYKTVDYNAIIGYLGKAIQELSAEITILKNK